MPYGNRFSMNLVTLFLLSVIVFAFNATPSTIANDDDSESQISTTALSAGQKLPALFAFTVAAAGIVLLLRVLWGGPAPMARLSRGRYAALSPIARGPPAIKSV